jgi:hypothetical protein
MQYRYGSVLWGERIPFHLYRFLLTTVVVALLNTVHQQINHLSTISQLWNFDSHVAYEMTYLRKCTKRTVISMTRERCWTRVVNNLLTFQIPVQRSNKCRSFLQSHFPATLSISMVDIVSFSTRWSPPMYDPSSLLNNSTTIILVVIFFLIEGILLNDIQILHYFSNPSR